MHRDREFLLDILESARLAIKYAEDKTEEEFLTDTQLQDAVIRRFEIIGEASRRISDEMQSVLPHLPWLECLLSYRNYDHFTTGGGIKKGLLSQPPCFSSVPNGIRTHVTALKGRCPRPG